ncbi:hypothetical protein LI012_17550 [Caldibacillus thermoamylovorans]|uniref:hypothetical protein n=1 Tax=Caldibacillus thermoamylovorans TaxID=35841 RepID=UPI001D079AEF|nr:hypothetical protein [Caldibacillus thermoamylovorans]MCB5936473.1 hypothetical protein [Bacillus sp. DFI.2.34]MCB7078588.1 hypothetical protein [Caldibacillus thermoamylovorans]
MNKRIKISIVALLLLFLLTITSTPASAQNNDMTQQKQILTERTKTDLISYWDKIGIKKENQKKILEKIRVGKQLDSEKANQTIEFTPKLLSEGGSITKEFGDGSFIILTVTPLKNNNNFSTAATCGSGYCIQTVKVSKWSVNSGASFNAKIVNVKNGYDYISSISNPEITVFGGTASNVDFKIAKKYEDANGRAHAYLRYDESILGIASNTTTIGIRVGNDTYSTYINR